MLLKDRLRQLRKNNGLTLAELALQSGLSISYLSDIERGKTNSSLRAIEAIANALDLPIVSLITGVEVDAEIDIQCLPDGLRQVAEEYQLDDDWLKMLSQIQVRGQSPQSADAWLEVYLHLRRVITDN